MSKDRRRLHGISEKPSKWTGYIMIPGNYGRILDENYEVDELSWTMPVYHSYDGVSWTKKCNLNLDEDDTIMCNRYVIAGNKLIVMNSTSTSYNSGKAIIFNLSEILRSSGDEIVNYSNIQSLYSSVNRTYPRLIGSLNGMLITTHWSTTGTKSEKVSIWNTSGSSLVKLNEIEVTFDRGYDGSNFFNYLDGHGIYPNSKYAIFGGQHSGRSNGLEVSCKYLVVTDEGELIVRDFTEIYDNGYYAPMKMIRIRDNKNIPHVAVFGSDGSSNPNNGNTMLHIYDVDMNLKWSGYVWSSPMFDNYIDTNGDIWSTKSPSSPYRYFYKLDCKLNGSDLNNLPSTIKFVSTGTFSSLENNGYLDSFYYWNNGGYLNSSEDGLVTVSNRSYYTAYGDANKYRYASSIIGAWTDNLHYDIAPVEHSGNKILDSYNSTPYVMSYL